MEDIAVVILVTAAVEICEYVIAPESMFVPAAIPSVKIYTSLKFALTSVATAAVPLTNVLVNVSVAIINL